MPQQPGETEAQYIDRIRLNALRRAEEAEDERDRIVEQVAAHERLLDEVLSTMYTARDASESYTVRETIDAGIVLIERWRITLGLAQTAPNEEPAEGERGGER